MSGSRMKELRRKGEVISLEARRAEREFAKALADHLETRAERRLRRRETQRKVTSAVILTVFAVSMISLVVLAVLN